VGAGAGVGGGIGGAARMPGSGVVRAGAKVSERRTVSERRSHSTEPGNPVKDAGGGGGGG